MAVLSSFTMTVLIALTANWSLLQSCHSPPLSVLMWILFPTTFFLSAATLEYLEDGDIGRALKVSLFYTGFAAVLIVVLYAVAAMLSPRPRLARHHQRPSPSIERAALRTPVCQIWKSQEA